MKTQTKPKLFSNPKVESLFLNLAICLLYVVSGKIGLSFATVNPSATAIWPPTGIALASLLLFGNRVIPAIFVGAFVVNVTTAGTIGTSLGIALGNTLEGYVGAYLINRFANGLHAFSTVNSIFKFFFFASIISTMVSADIGLIMLLVSKLASWKDFVPVWLTWWLGDMSGSLIITPLFLVWGTSSRLNIYFRNTVHILLTYFVLLLTTWIVFSGILPYAYLCIPIAVWIAFWFGRRGASIATILVAGIAIFCTLHGFGPFVIGPNQSLIFLQLFLGILSLTSLTFASLVHTIRKSELTLAYREARFKALIEKSFDAVVLIDAASTIVYASPSVTRVLGFAPEELTGTIGFNLITPEDRQYTMRELAKLVLKPGGTVTIEYRVIRKNKQMIWVEATGTNLLFDTKVNAVVVNFHDITEEKELQEKILREKTEDEAMLASIGDGIIATDNTGKIMMVNKSACEILGFTRRELIGKSITTMIPMEDEMNKLVPLEERPITKVLSKRRKIVTARSSYLKKDKSKFPVRFTVTPIIIEGNVTGIIEVFQDITREKEIDRMKDEFISMASHELRTPMTAINGLLSMIFHGDYGPINEKLQHPLDNVRISAERQIHLINDLLDVSRLQTGRIEFTITDFPIYQTLEEVVKALMPIAQQKGLKLILQKDEEIKAHADIEWSKRILNNLIGNSLKFTDKGTVAVSYSSDINFIYISVSDTGIGIDPNDLDKLFGRFQQLNGQIANKPPGSGLGLFLSRELSRKMEGDVKLVRSQIGKGSTFIFSLPKSSINNSSFTTKKEIAFSSHTS